MKIQLKRSNVLVDNNARQPTPGQMEYGELAVNYNNNDPAIFIKDSNNNIVRIAGKYNIADDGQVELPASPTPPSDPKAGNLWYNNTDGRLYIYYTDADSSQWVDASPDSWDPSSYPDVSDDTAQSGTLDDRYLMLNSANDPITNGLNITTGNVGIGTGSPSGKLHVETSAGNFKVTNFGSSSINIENSKASGTIRQIAAGGFRFASNDSTELARITGGGFVGIGTDNPATNLDVNGSIYLASVLRSTSGGTAANPSIQPGNDADTGIFHPTDTNTIGFSTAGAERVRIGNSGAVGIGAFPPASLVHAEGARDYTGATPGLTSYDYNLGSGTAFVAMGQSAGTPAIQGHGAGTSYHLALNPNVGNVGIGVTDPLDVLHISKGANSSIRLGAKTGDYAYRIRANVSSSVNGGFLIEDPVSGTNLLQIRSGASGFHAFYIDGTEKARVDSTGNFGVGDTAPAGQLTVRGNGTSYNTVLLLTSEQNAVSTECKVRMIGNNTTGSTSQICELVAYQPSGSNSGDAALDINVRNNGDPFSSPSYCATFRAGRLGIGTQSPQSALHLKGSSFTNVQIEADTNDASVSFLNNASGGEWTVRNDASVSDQFAIRYNNTARIVVATNGNVGLGATAGLDQKLNVNGGIVSTSACFVDRSQGKSYLGGSSVYGVQVLDTTTRKASITWSGVGTFASSRLMTDPNNTANYTTTTDEFGNQIEEYTGPVFDMGDRLLKADAALLSLKSAAATATDFTSLKTAIVNALANI